MILEQLTVRNFCLYRGEQTFDLTPVTAGGRHRPIVLIGGINGGGKTTLLDAIQLALYGNRARCSNRARSKSPCSSRLIRRSRLRLNAAVTPAESS